MCTVLAIVKRRIGCGIRLCAPKTGKTIDDVSTARQQSHQEIHWLGALAAELQATCFATSNVTNATGRDRKATPANHMTRFTNVSRKTHKTRRKSEATSSECSLRKISQEKVVTIAPPSKQDSSTHCQKKTRTVFLSIHSVSVPQDQRPL